MVILGLLIKELFELMQANIKRIFEVPIEVTDGCLIMGNGDIANNDINANTLHFHYRHKAEIEKNKIFGEIIQMLNGIDNYEEEILSTGDSVGHSVESFNTIPYGLPSICHEKLVVIVDGKKDIGFIINKALLHVGIACKGDTSHVLFYITIDKAKWEEIWLLYKPAFNKLESEKSIKFFMHFNLKN